METIYPCLWFDTQAEEAAQLYVSLFKGAKITKTTRFTAASARAAGKKEGAVMTVEFELSGRKFMGLNGGPQFRFTPALSVFVWCNSDKEIERLWKALGEGGEIRMGLDKYPWAPKYGWTTDRYGVDWQLMLGDKEGLAPAFLFVDQLFGKGDEALAFYRSVFKDSQTESLVRDETTGTIMHTVFTLAGSRFALMEGKGEHGFTFSPAFSLVANCKTQGEIDHYWSKLSHDPAAEQCGWLKDRYGVSWQIIPADLGQWMSDAKRAERVMSALLEMKKIDIDTLKKA